MAAESQRMTARIKDGTGMPNPRKMSKARMKIVIFFLFSGESEVKQWTRDS